MDAVDNSAALITRTSSCPVPLYSSRSHSASRASHREHCGEDGAVGTVANTEFRQNGRQPTLVSAPRPVMGVCCTMRRALFLLFCASCFKDTFRLFLINSCPFRRFLRPILDFAPPFLAFISPFNCSPCLFIAFPRLSLTCPSPFPRLSLAHSPISVAFPSSPLPGSSLFNHSFVNFSSLFR